MIFIKEIILKQATDILLKFLKSDIDDNQADMTKSYLAKIIGEQKKIGNYDFFEQAVAVFGREEKDTRKIAVDYMYNMKRDRFPSLYIALAADTPSPGTMAMGARI